MKKNVLITGGASGIGYHLALDFALEGYNVIVLDKNNVVFNDASISFYKLDLRDFSALGDCFVKIKERFKTLHILINNAAISVFEKDIRECSLGDFDNIIAVNLKAMYFCSKEFLALNEREDFGRIINIASTRFAQNEPNWDLYATTKGAVVSLTSSLCISLSDTPITVNAISAGWIATKNYDKLSPLEHSQHPSGRVGKARDISSYCLFLAKEENDFINGSNLFIDGGMSKKMIYPSDFITD